MSLGERLQRIFGSWFGYMPTPEKWVFIVGCYNSGTTLLHDLLASHHNFGQGIAKRLDSEDIAAGALSFESGLRLVQQRALAMQKACELEERTMAAVLGLEDAVVEQACDEIGHVVVPANYNCPGQVVISGELGALARAGKSLLKKVNDITRECLNRRCLKSIIPTSTNKKARSE